MMENKKDLYAKSVCFFLAEQLRTKNISLSRAAEIAQHVLDNIKLVDTEQDFLQLVKSLSADFEELCELTQRIQFDIKISQRRDLETQVRQFAATCLPQDPHLALCVLQEAVKEEVDFNYLCGKFPEFKQFVTVKSDA